MTANPQAAAAALAAAMDDACRSCNALTDLQREVLVLLSKGLTKKEVATAMSLEMQDIENHTHSMLRRLGVRRAIEAAVIATKAGLV